MSELDPGVLDKALGPEAHEALGAYIGPGSARELAGVLTAHLGRVVGLYVQVADGRVVLTSMGALGQQKEGDSVYEIGGVEGAVPPGIARFVLFNDALIGLYTGGARLHLSVDTDLALVLAREPHRRVTKA